MHSCFPNSKINILRTSLFLLAGYLFQSGYLSNQITEQLRRHRPLSISVKNIDSGQRRFPRLVEYWQHNLSSVHCSFRLIVIQNYVGFVIHLRFDFFVMVHNGQHYDWSVFLWNIRSDFGLPTESKDGCMHLPFSISKHRQWNHCIIFPQSANDGKFVLE